MRDRQVLLGVTGGIAAYKSAELVRRLVERGAQVQVVMTKSAREFVGAATFQALVRPAGARQPVGRGRRSGDGPHRTRALGRRRPRRAGERGFHRAPRARIRGRPAQHAVPCDFGADRARAGDEPADVGERGDAGQRRAAARARRALLGPATGDQACGETGPGRMLEPNEIAEAIATTGRSGSFAGKRVLITAGPTREAIDPVRFVSNRSSGKMGFAVAAAMRAAGAEVVLVSGPVNLEPPPGVRCIEVETAAQMLEAVQRELPGTHVLVATAAVADYRPESVADRKIKKKARAHDPGHDADRGHPGDGGRRHATAVHGRIRRRDRFGRAACARQARAQEARHDRGQRGRRDDRPSIATTTPCWCSGPAAAGPSWRARPSARWRPRSSR